MSTAVRVASLLCSLTVACGDGSAATATEAGSTVGTSDSTHGDGTSTSSSGTSGSSSESSTGAPELPSCPSFADGEQVGALVDPAIVETSGLVASRTQPDVLWLHNDSGDTPRVFAVRPTGETIASYLLEGAIALDWEDMALGPGPEADVDYLYLADIGDNGTIRGYVTVYRVPEPVVDAAGGEGLPLGGVVPVDLKYPDGPHNAETLLSDPLTGDLLIVTKEDAGPSRVFRAVAPIDVEGKTTMEEIATLSFGVEPLPGNPLATGGDIADDGSLVVVRTYSHAFAWRRPAGLDLAEAFAGPPCPLPTLPDADGEAIAVLPGLGGLVTISEGAMVPVRRFAAQ
jgi:hypothetical protein